MGKINCSNKQSGTGRQRRLSERVWGKEKCANESKYTRIGVSGWSKIRIASFVFTLGGYLRHDVPRVGDRPIQTK